MKIAATDNVSDVLIHGQQVLFIMSPKSGVLYKVFAGQSKLRVSG